MMLTRGLSTHSTPRSGSTASSRPGAEIRQNAPTAGNLCSVSFELSTNALPITRCPNADEYSARYDSRQRALASAVAQALQLPTSLSDEWKTILLSRGRGAHGVDPRERGWRVLGAALAGWLQGADQGAMATLLQCQRRPETTPAEEEESNDME